MNTSDTNKIIELCEQLRYALEGSGASMLTDQGIMERDRMMRALVASIQEIATKAQNAG